MTRSEQFGEPERPQRHTGEFGVWCSGFDVQGSEVVHGSGRGALVLEFRVQG